MNRIPRDEQWSPGQTLIELLVALFVITVGLTAAGSVVFSNVRLQERSADQVVGANLAREGVELAKAVRDSNWVAGAGTPFDQGLYSGTDYSAVPRMDGGVFLSFDFAPTSTASPEAILKRSTNNGSLGLYVQGTGASGADTVFRRVVLLAPICSDGRQVAEGASCPGATPKIGIHVTSTVQWTKKDGTRRSTVEDEIYDWR